MHIVYTANALDDKNTEVHIAHETSFEFLRCFERTKREKRKKGEKDHEPYSCKICGVFLERGLNSIMSTDDNLEHLHSIKSNEKVTNVPESYGTEDDKKDALFVRQGHSHSHTIPQTLVPHEFFRSRAFDNHIFLEIATEQPILVQSFWSTGGE